MLLFLLWLTWCCTSHPPFADAPVTPPAPAPVMLADAGAPTVLAGTPDAVMLADAGTPAVLADAPLAVMLLAPPLKCTHPLPSPFPPSWKPDEDRRFADRRFP